ARRSLSAIRTPPRTESYMAPRPASPAILDSFLSQLSIRASVEGWMYWKRDDLAEEKYALSLARGDYTVTCLARATARHPSAWRRSTFHRAASLRCETRGLGRAPIIGQAIGALEAGGRWITLKEAQCLRPGAGVLLRALTLDSSPR